MAMRIVKTFFSAFSGPCSYSLITDWIHPQNRTLAYAFYTLGVQFGSPFAPLVTSLIDELGWRATFQFLALMGFIVLGICLLSFDEPERGRFDINHSVLNNPDESLKSGSKANFAYELSKTGKNLNIKHISEKSSSRMFGMKEYCLALRELFTNDCALWILLAACLRTQ